MIVRIAWRTSVWKMAEVILGAADDLEAGGELEIIAASRAQQQSCITGDFDLGWWLSD